MNKRISSIFILTTVIILAVVWSTPASATQATCQQTGGWVKVDNLSGSSYLYTAPAGSQIVEVCYKHSTFMHTFSITPAASYLVTVDCHTDQHQGHLHCYDLSHASFRSASVPTATPTEVPPTATPTEVIPTKTPDPTVTPTDVPPTPTEVVTDVPTPTPTVDFCEQFPEECEQHPTPTPAATPQDRVCPFNEIGELFLLHGPEGQQGWLASYQRNPNTGLWAIPNTGSQQRCLGWIAVNASEGRLIYADCNGNVNILTHRCEGGGPCKAYIDD